MSGPIVEMIGGPLDGTSRHLATYKRVQEAFFEVGDWNDGTERQIHVYRSWGGTLPFEYRGVRPWKGEVVLPLVLP